MELKSKTWYFLSYNFWLLLTVGILKKIYNPSKKNQKGKDNTFFPHICLIKK